MRKLILAIFLFFLSFSGRSQTYECDSTTFYPDAYVQRYRIRAEVVYITIEGTNMTITQADSSTENFNITDTLLKTVFPDTTYIILYVIENAANRKDQRIMSILYTRKGISSFGIMKENDELTIYHVKFILNNG